MLGALDVGVGALGASGRRGVGALGAAKCSVLASRQIPSSFFRLFILKKNEDLAGREEMQDQVSFEFRANRASTWHVDAFPKAVSLGSN